ncbi:MAG: hypothetical protein CVT98_08095 [Bacteroidetes bacterium HGW-Bacteroidetes-15]|nr:MAG: hypothetical protein CVT98_08095 [Bacteroidetes bacterium HGW-Bacteroidetes-15]
MIIKFFPFLAFVLFFVKVDAQNAESLKLTRSDLPGMEETRFSVYDENSLWGYINGGADLYLEYGFSEMFAQDFVWETEPFKVDAYLMHSPEAAFGIFSVSRFSCKSNGTNASWDCVNPYQVQVAYGNLYLSVVAYNGTVRSMELAVKIANNFIKKIKVKEFTLPNFIPQEDIEINHSGVKLIMGQLAMQNSYVALENEFTDGSNYQFWVIPFSIDAKSYEMIMVNFENNEISDQVAQKILSNEKKRETYHLEKNGSKILLLKNFNKDTHPDKFKLIVEKFKELK